MLEDMIKTIALVGQNVWPPRQVLLQVVSLLYII